jgi:hypothetical protein
MAQSAALGKAPQGVRGPRSASEMGHFRREEFQSARAKVLRPSGYPVRSGLTGRVRRYTITHRRLSGILELKRTPRNGAGRVLTTPTPVLHSHGGGMVARCRNSL